MPAGRGWDGRGAVSKIMTWCTGLALLGAVAGCGQPAAVRAAGSQAVVIGSWGKAIEVSGLAALRKGGTVGVLSLSCASAGSCATGGYYLDRHGHRQGFVAAVRNGAWARVMEVPGLGALDKGGRAEVLSVSCGSAGSCAAGGYYLFRHGHRLGFVAVERNGVWGKAIGVPGLAALNVGGDGGVSSVSCAPAGSCAAGGFYAAGHGHRQGFVAVERNGVWGKAAGVPGLEALNKGGDVGVSSVSCASAGSCVAGGFYNDKHFNSQGFVAVERNGVWGKAIEMPGPGAVSKGGYGAVSSVSCASAGSCVAGGYHEYGEGERGFVAVEKNGVWGAAIEMPGPGPLNKGEGQVNSVSCVSAGSCVAGGNYTDGRGYGQGFVVSEKNGVWGTAIEVPGLGALNKGTAYVQVSSVSCASAGNCAAGGSYPDGDDNGQGFVAVEKNGTWATATEVPGLGALNQGGDAGVSAVSCAPAGSCAAGGSYADGDGNSQGFAAVEKNGTWSTATGVPGLGTLGPPSKGRDAGVDSVSCGSAGNCAAGGSYSVGHGNDQGFVADERNGRWGKATAVPGLVALNKGGLAGVGSVSCASAGNCAAGGSYADADSHDIWAFVAVEENGVWGKAVTLPVGDGEVDSVSCASAGNCLAGGAASADYTSSNDHGFLAELRNGRWGKATAVPGLAALNQGGDAGVNSVSCGAAGNCTASGYYKDSHRHYQGFVAVEKNGVWGKATAVPGLAALNKGGNAGVNSVSCGAADSCAAGGILQGRSRPLSGVRGRRAERRLGPGDRGARPGGAGQGRGRLRWLGVVRLGGQLRGRRILQGQPRPLSGVRGRRAERPLEPGDQGAGPGGPEQGRERPGLGGVVRLGGQLRGRRVLRQPR